MQYSAAVGRCNEFGGASIVLVAILLRVPEGLVS